MAKTWIKSSFIWTNSTSKSLATYLVKREWSISPVKLLNTSPRTFMQMALWNEDGIHEHWKDFRRVEKFDMTILRKSLPMMENLREIVNNQGYPIESNRYKKCGIFKQKSTTKIVPKSANDLLYFIHSVASFLLL